MQKRPKNGQRAYFFGFSRWKRRYVRPFFREENLQIHFVSNLREALRKGLDTQSRIYLWGLKPFEAVETFARKKGIPLYRVEDGFVRSITLGSDLTRPYSLVVDSRGIYFDPRHESDLEWLLNYHDFDDELLARSRALQHYLLENRISKYNIHRDRAVELPGHRKGQTILLVPGQVEDDASILYGADGMSNLELLKAAREANPEGYILFKPHPDVLAGNRKGNVPEEIAGQYCDLIVTDASLDSVLELCDEVHTMTSLVGFEALIRGKSVHTYGLPFYAGWGLTHDRRHCERRKARRSLDELVAAAYLLYPRYLDPASQEPCEIEVTLAGLETMKRRYNSDRLYRSTIDTRNWISRKIQLLIKVTMGE